MSSSSASLAIQQHHQHHQHHHHYSHHYEGSAAPDQHQSSSVVTTSPVSLHNPGPQGLGTPTTSNSSGSGSSNHHHHLHHHHYQQQQQPVSSLHFVPQQYIPGSAPFPTRSSAALHHGPSAALSSSSSSDFVPESKCCAFCRCSNRLLTGIVITILPIAITSTLICVFMMQKTNLHQYAIYSFVIFCVAFVFPFALFFFTVILNKIYKFYKREIRSNPSNNLHSMIPDNCDSDSGGQIPSSTGYNIQTAGTALGSASNSPRIHSAAAVSNAAVNGQTANLICYSSRAYHQPYYYQTEDGTIVAFAPENALIIEDSPPSYEMALLCPSVTHSYPTNYSINPSMHVILPKPEFSQSESKQQEKSLTRFDSRSHQYQHQHNHHQPAQQAQLDSQLDPDQLLLAEQRSHLSQADEDEDNEEAHEDETEEDDEDEDDDDEEEAPIRDDEDDDVEALNQLESDTDDTNVPIIIDTTE